MDGEEGGVGEGGRGRKLCLMEGFFKILFFVFLFSLSLSLSLFVYVSLCFCLCLSVLVHAPV